MNTDRIKIVAVLLLYLSSPVFSENIAFNAQPAAEKLFVKKINAGGRVADAIQTNDDAYLSLSSTGDTTFLVRKSSASGKRIWETSLSFPAAKGALVTLRSITQTNDGFILVGDGSFDGSPDISLSTALIVALHSDGSINWTKRFDQNGNLYFNSVSSSPDGGFVVTGGAYPPDFHPIVVKFTSNGHIQWQKAFEDLVLSYPLLSQRVPDGFILASQDAIVLKIDDSGNLVWKRHLNIPNFRLETLTAESNRVFVAGNSHHPGSVLLISLDENGRLQWKAKYSLGFPSVSISSVTKTLDGGYVLVGAFKYSTGVSSNGFLLKIDGRRNLVFQKLIGTLKNREEARSVFATNSGGYVLFGSSDKDLLLLNLNSEGIVPGCNFFRDRKSKIVHPVPVSNTQIELSEDTLSLPTPGPVQINSKGSRKSVSVICQ